MDYSLFIWVTAGSQTQCVSVYSVCFHKQITGVARAANDGLDFVVGEWQKKMQLNLQEKKTDLDKTEV